MEAEIRKLAVTESLCLSYLTLGVGDLDQLISWEPGPVLKLAGARGFVVNLPVSGTEETSWSSPAGVTMYSTLTS